MRARERSSVYVVQMSASFLLPLLLGGYRVEIHDKVR